MEIMAIEINPFSGYGSQFNSIICNLSVLLINPQRGHPASTNLLQQ